MTEEIRESTSTFSCSGCGGRPVWDPASRKLKCPYCGAMTDVQMDTGAPLEYPIDSAPAEDAWGEEKRVIHCEACGAETILGKGESASFCSFCGSPHVLEDQSAAGIAPESVLPFAIAKEQAVSSFRNWLRKRRFAPGKAKKMAALGQIAGVYLPHWTYDSSTTARYTGEAGYHYYVEVPVTVVKDGKKVTETRKEQRTRWEPASGVVHSDFDDIVIPGSERLESGLLQTVQPYDLSGLCRYQAAFLAGFQAEKAAVTVQQGWEKAQRVIQSRMNSLATHDILSHADEARVSRLDSRHENVRYKLTLLPMYLSSFTFKDKAYHVLVNGQSGKCSGEAPVSPWRVLLAILIAAGLIAGAWYLITSGQNPAPLAELPVA